MIKTYYFNGATERMQHDVDLQMLDGLLGVENSLLWVDVFDFTEQELTGIGEQFGFHPLAIEDCLHDSPRSKIDRYDGYDFFVLHALKYNEESDREVTTGELDVFMAPNYVVTVHKSPIGSIGDIAVSSHRESRFMCHGPDFLLYSIVDGITDSYFPVVERLSIRIDELETELYEHPALEITEEFLSLKRTLVVIRRVIQSKMRVFAQVGTPYSFPVRQEHVPYYMDLVDHLERISDSLEVFRDLVSGAMDTYSSLGTARTNETMRILTVITTLTATLTLITGVWGMNVPLPFQKSWWATLLVVTAMVVVTVAMMAMFRRRKWI